jgi:hypothetical protein
MRKDRLQWNRLMGITNILMGKSPGVLVVL